jgi:hypothetical protein
MGITYQEEDRPTRELGEIEITPQMVEAGADAIGLYSDGSGARFFLRRAAEEAYLAMREAAASSVSSRLSEEDDAQ